MTMLTTNQDVIPSHIQPSGEDEETVISVDEALDLDALAEEIVRLLKQELRIEGERQGWRRLW